MTTRLSRLLIPLVVVGLLAGGGWLLVGASRSDTPSPRPAAERRLPPPIKEEPERGADPPPQVAEAIDPSEAVAQRDEREEQRELARQSADDPTDSAAEIRRQIAQLKRALRGGSHVGARAKVLANGEAVAPRNAPEVVQNVIAAANTIARTPYKWGGGHGAWRDSGYDCSGSVSFALAGAGLLDGPLNSSGFLDYGDPGRGRWITIYTNPGHMFMVVAGLRFDTSGRGRAGTRWQAGSRGTSGFTARHPPGL